MGSVADLFNEILFNCPLSAATTGSEVGNTLSGTHSVVPPVAVPPFGGHGHGHGC